MTSLAVGERDECLAAVGPGEIVRRQACGEMGRARRNLRRSVCDRVDQFTQSCNGNFDFVAGFQEGRRLLPETHTGRCPCRNHIAGHQGRALGDGSYELGDGEDQVVCRAVLAFLAVHVRLYA